MAGYQRAQIATGFRRSTSRAMHERLAGHRRQLFCGAETPRLSCGEQYGEDAIRRSHQGCS